MPYMTYLHDLRALIETGEYAAALALIASGRVPPQTAEATAEITVLKIAALNGLGRWNEAITTGESALTEFSALNLKRQVGHLHGLLGLAHMRIGSTRDAESHLRAAIHITTWDLGDPEEAIRQQRRLALLFLGLGSWRQAQYEIENAIALADKSGIVRESGGLRVNLAITLIKAGTLSSVPQLIAEAESFLDQAGQKKWLMQAHLVRANYLRISGQPRKALELLIPALQLTREQKYSREEAIALEYIGDCHLLQSEHKRALDHFEAAMKIADATAPDGDIVPEVCHRMGEALVHLGDPNAAILLCERGLRAAHLLNDRYEECGTYRVYAMAQRAAGNRKKSLRVADEGIKLGRRCEIPYELARTLAWAGEARLQDSSPDEQAQGRRQLWEARAIFDRMGLAIWVRMLDQLLGYDSEPGHPSDELGLSSVADLGDLDHGALRFGIITCSPQVRDAVATVQSIAPSQIPVLITGESGVGKELLAQALHKMSDRRKAPFVPVNCGAIAVNLLDSEFFGHERGAFTGAVANRGGLLASADKGTLFLDEVSELPPPVQAALLRVLETGELRALGRDEIRKIDIRVVAATNARLEDLVDRGLFRQDLFYRLNGVRVAVPPLREREEDIQALFRFFWSRTVTSSKKKLTVGEGVEALLCAYDWPGNVRELRNEIARVVTITPDGSVVGCGAFLPQLRQKDVGVLRRNREQLDKTAEEREQIVRALRAHRGNKSDAARSLGGMKRTTLIYKIERLGIRPEEYLTKD